MVRCVSEQRIRETILKIINMSNENSCDLLWNAGLYYASLRRQIVSGVSWNTERNFRIRIYLTEILGRLIFFHFISLMRCNNYGFCW